MCRLSCVRWIRQTGVPLLEKRSPDAKLPSHTTAPHLHTFALACMADVYKVGQSKGPVERRRFTQKTPRQVGRFTRSVLSRAAFRAACQIYRGGTRGFDRFPHRSVASGTCSHPCALSLSDLHRRHLQLVKKKKKLDQEMMICMRSSQRYERKMIRKQSDVRIKIVVLVH